MNIAPTWAVFEQVGMFRCPTKSSTRADGACSTNGTRRKDRRRPMVSLPSSQCRQVVARRRATSPPAQPALLPLPPTLSAVLPHPVLFHYDSVVSRASQQTRPSPARYGMWDLRCSLRTRRTTSGGGNRRWAKMARMIVMRMRKRVVRRTMRRRGSDDRVGGWRRRMRTIEGMLGRRRMRLLWREGGMRLEKNIHPYSISKQTVPCSLTAIFHSP